MTDSVATSQMATLPSTSSYSNLITAEIRVENLSASPVEQSATISVPTSSQQTADVSVDEPEKKRQKLDSHPTKVKKLEKLESRLGGILCCAVCLDLPRAAMYQVSAIQFPHFFGCVWVPKYLVFVLITPGWGICWLSGWSSPSGTVDVIRSRRGSEKRDPKSERRKESITKIKSREQNNNKGESE